MRGSVGGTVGRGGTLMSDRLIVCGGVPDDGGVDDEGVDDCVLLGGEGGDPIWEPPGIRLGSGNGNGTGGKPASASFMYAPQMPAG